ncbi:MAG: MFS transporter [archaeon]
MHKQIKDLIFINGFFVFAINMFAPLYALFIQKLSTDVIHVGLIWAVYIICSGVFVFFISRYENHLKYADYFLVAGFLMRVVGWTGYLFASSLWHIYAIQLFLALGEAFGTPSYNSLFSWYLDKTKFASEWGMNQAINSFIMGAAAFIGAAIVQRFGFNALFAVMIVLSFISTFLAIRFRRQLNTR